MVVALVGCVACGLVDWLAFTFARAGFLQFCFVLAGCWNIVYCYINCLIALGVFLVTLRCGLWFWLVVLCWWLCCRFVLVLIVLFL